MVVAFKTLVCTYSPWMYSAQCVCVCVSLCVFACVCVCVCEREREREGGGAGRKRKIAWERVREWQKHREKTQTEGERSYTKSPNNANRPHVQTVNAWPKCHGFTLLCIYYYTNDSQPETQNSKQERRPMCGKLLVCLLAISYIHIYKTSNNICKVISHF